jgi:protein SCO1/2
MRAAPPMFMVAALTLACLFCAGNAMAQLQDPMQSIGIRPELLKNVGIDQKLNSQIPLDLSFRNEQGQAVQLNQYFNHGKPVILTLVYYNCPMLCTQVLNGLLDTMKHLKIEAGKDYEVLTISIDPTERPILAAAKHDLYTGLYGRPAGAAGWHFMTGDEAQIKQLANAVGFRYAYDPDSKQFAHASTIIVLTPEGKISRYFYGIQYPARDLRFGLMEASEGRIGSPVDQILLFCYHYDPVTGKYGIVISHLVKIAGGLTVLVIGLLVFFLARGEHYALPERRA